MQKIQTVFLLIIVLNSFIFSFSENLHNKTQIIENGIDQVLRHDYKKADSLFTYYYKISKDPVYLFGRVIIYETMMIDYETTEFEDKFDSLYMITKNQINELYKQNNNDPWLAYYLGALYVIKGGHELRFHNYFNFTKNIFKGMGLLEKSVELDSTITDAYVFLGIYNYAKANIFGWVTFWNNSKAEAITLIKKARKNSFISKEVASLMLVGLYGQNNAVKKAEKIANDFFYKYPANRTILWVLLNMYIEREMYDKAFKTITKLDKEIKKIPSKYIYNRISLNIIKAEIYYEIKEYKRSAYFCSKVIDINNSNKRIEKIIKKAKKLKKKSLSRLNDR